MRTKQSRARGVRGVVSISPTDSPDACAAPNRSTNGRGRRDAPRLRHEDSRRLQALPLVEIADEERHLNFARIFPRNKTN